MRRHSAPVRRIAYLLAATAGFVDATGFLETRGLFISFMTGNSTRLSVSLHDAPDVARLAAILIACFVGGVVLGASIDRGRNTSSRVPLLVALLLLAAGLAKLSGIGTLPAILAAVAMGAINLTFRRDGEAAIAVGYVTGTLVRLGQRLADGLAGERRWREALPDLMLWSSLLTGAMLGAWLGQGGWTQNYFLASAFVAILSLMVRRQQEA